jgi:hypothetical protein
VRHVVSVVLAPVLGVVVYILVGIAVARGVDPGGGWSVDHAIAVAAALGAGAAYAAMLLPRWSPVGLILVGLGYLALTGWAYSDTSSFRDIVPSDILGSNYAGWIPASPLTAALAVPLLATVLSGRRWRRHPHRATQVMRPAYAPPPPPPPADPSGYPAYGSGGTTVPLAYSDPVSVPPYPSPGPPPNYPLMNPDQTQRL